MAKGKQTRAEAVRAAVDEAFQTTAAQVEQGSQFARDRAQELVEDLSGAAGRLRDVLDDLRPPGSDEVRELRAEVRALAERVARLEQSQGGGSRRPSRPRPAKKD